MKKNLRYILFTIMTMSIMTKVSAAKCVACGSDMMPIPETIPLFVSKLIVLAQILVPLILIITGMIKYAKVVLSGEDKEAREVNKSFIRSIILAFSVFLVVSIVKFVFVLVDKANNNETNTNSCINCFINGNCGTTYTCPTRDEDLETWKEKYNKVANPTGACKKLLTYDACSKRDDCVWGTIDQSGTQGCQDIKKCKELSTETACNKRSYCNWKNNKCQNKACKKITDYTACASRSDCTWGTLKSGQSGCYSK